MSKNVEYRNEMQMDRDVRSDAIAVRTILGSEGSLNWSREIWILVKRLLGAASRKYSGSQMIPLVNSRRQRQSNLPSDVDNGQVEMGNLTMSRSSGMNST